MLTINGIPVYAAAIGEAEGMIVLSLVDDAAVESNFLAFAKDDEKHLEFAIKDEDKHIVIGCVMRANFLIPRYDSSIGNYYITYSPETIREMVQKFFRNGYQNNVDTNHNFKLEDGIYLEQAFIKDTEKGISPVGFEDIEEGSLFFQYKVENENIWQSIKKGEWKGFSLAGNFQLEETFNRQEINNDNKENRFMTKLQKMKDALRNLLVEVEFGSVNTDKGVIVWDSDEEELKEGMSVYTLDADNNRVELADGDYTTEDGKTIVVVDGKVAEIRDPKAEIADEEPAEEENNEDEGNEEPQSEEELEEEPVSEEEPKDDEEPVQDEKDALIEELKARIAELESENEQLKARIAELEKEPAAPNADEAFEAQQNNENRPLTKRERMEKKGYKFNY